MSQAWDDCQHLEYRAASNKKKFKNTNAKSFIWFQKKINNFGVIGDVIQQEHLSNNFKEFSDAEYKAVGYGCQNNHYNLGKMSLDSIWTCAGRGGPAVLCASPMPGTL